MLITGGQERGIISPGCRALQPVTTTPLFVSNVFVFLSFQVRGFFLSSSGSRSGLRKSAGIMLLFLSYLVRPVRYQIKDEKTIAEEINIYVYIVEYEKNR